MLDHHRHQMSPLCSFHRQGTLSPCSTLFVYCFYGGYTFLDVLHAIFQRSTFLFVLVSSRFLPEGISFMGYAMICLVFFLSFNIFLFWHEVFMATKVNFICAQLMLWEILPFSLYCD